MDEALGKGIRQKVEKIYLHIKRALESQNNKKLLLLILLSGVFCFRSFAVADRSEARAKEDINIQKNVFLKPNNEKISLKTNVKEGLELISSLEKFPLSAENEAREDVVSLLEQEIVEIVDGYPLKNMAPSISRYERQVAALAVGIAKKESDWGRRAPSKNGKDCYNYWGYKGSGKSGTAMGYACFASAEEAVKTVVSRIEYFVNKNLNTPARMVVWKCGFSCSWDNPKNVAKWISDVSIYYNRIAYAK